MQTQPVLARAFLRWISKQDLAALGESGPLVWVFTMIFGVGICVSFATIPIIGLKIVWAPILALSLACCVGLYVHKLLRTGQTLSTWQWVLVLIDSSLVQLYLALIVALSEPFGSAIAASLLLVAMATHGWVHHARVSEPFLTIGSTIAVAIAFSVTLGIEQQITLGIAWSAGTFTSLILGHQAVQIHLRDKQQDAARAAVLAQLLQERHEDAAFIGGQQHKARESVRALTMGLEMSADHVDLGSDRGHELLAEMRNHLAELANSLGMAQAAPAGKDDTAVNIGSAVKQARQRCRWRFPDKRISALGNDELLVHVVGTDTLERILDELMTNAAEGSGPISAETINITYEREQGFVLLTIDDDGPGFTDEQLTEGIEPFATTKASGGGLGLLTVQRLVRACGGLLSMSRSPTLHGGRVTVTLAQAPESMQVEETADQALST